MMKDVIIRTISIKTDIEKYIEFGNIAHADYPDHRDLTVKVAKEHIFNDPEYNENGHFLAIFNDEIIGSGIANQIQDNIGSISIMVKPKHRFMGVEEKLLQQIINYFKSQKINEMVVSIPSQFNNFLNFYHSNGFKSWKSNYHMVCDTFLIQSQIPDAYIVKSENLQDINNEIISILNRGFDNEDTKAIIDEYQRISKEDYFDMGGVIIAQNKSSKQIVGTSINIVHPALPTRGFICWITVLKEERRKGLGKALLLESIKWFKGKGVESIELDVDLEEPSAIKLYESCGFKIMSETKELKRFINKY